MPEVRAYSFGVGRLLKRLKEAVEWAVAIWHVLGWLGLAALATGVGAAIGGGIWAVVRGIPLPIALLAAYCTFVGAVYLAMTPMLFRALSVAPAGGRRHGPRPNFAEWRQVELLTLAQAASLWCGEDPHARITSSAVRTRLTIFYDAVKRRQLRLVPGPGYDSHDLARWTAFPDTYCTTTRTLLKAFAEARGDTPEFLRD